MNTVDDGHSRVYQPERVSFSSKDDKTSLSNDATIGLYDSFIIPLNTPILGVKSLELIRATVPCIYTTLPDSELVFWYYKLPKQVNFDEPVPPDIQYLHCVRLQPSFIPKELIYPVGEDYPDNRVYDGYEDLLADLNKACLYDVNNPYFIAGDIKFEYDKEMKKIVFIGNRQTMSLLGANVLQWNNTRNYMIGDRVILNNNVYQARYENANISPADTTIVTDINTNTNVGAGSLYWVFISAVQAEVRAFILTLATMTPM